ncbi:helix-turn-helix transcriptional regulator [Streptomyces sp. HNM0663]|uniref:Helix-turn-helix transcriptional regulator n=1 Tax=Streptomyces chengmaiensis TaxID=3040919 RepID=A0ABT6HXV0_9ACTN|nr:helix-turn-helix transcriptional regulator [Streptomyces chengmaiensis]MDH2393166.1 helix-turn-helix transcriptional regulator [Streptomyces chengmaiensis]
MVDKTRQLDPSASPLAYYGSELRRLREAAQLSQENLGGCVFCTGSQIGHIESGRRMPTRDFSERLDAALGTDGTFSRLVGLVLRNQLPTWFQPYADMEARATYIASYQAQLVDGLLQTEEYARAVLASGMPDRLEELVAARMERQRILAREQPPMLWVVLDEAALHRPVGGAKVMRAQLAHLLTLSGHRWIKIQVLPFAAGEHASLIGSFNILRFERDPDLVYTEDLVSGHMTANPDDVREAALRYAHVQAAALSVEDSAALIARVMEERYGKHPGPDGRTVA